MRRAPAATGPCDARVASASKRLLYLYAVTDARGVDERLRAEPISGLDPGETVFALASGGLLALVSRVPEATFQEDPLNALLADLPRLAPFVVAHEEVVRSLLGVCPSLIPMRFGAVYRGPESVVALLGARRPEFQRTLDRLREKEEWGLKLFLDPSRLLEAAANATDELRSLADAIASASPGRAYLLGKRREQRRAAEARVLLRATVDGLVAELAKLSAAVHRDALMDAEHGDPQLVLKAAFLVDRAAAERFCSVVSGWQQRCAAIGCTLELNGPWAPYSFADSTADSAAQAPGKEGEPRGGA